MIPVVTGLVIITLTSVAGGPWYWYVYGMLLIVAGWYLEENA